MPKIPNSSNATSANLQAACSSRQSLAHRQTTSRTSPLSDSAAISTNTQQTPTISAQQQQQQQQTNQRGISSATNEVPPSSTSEQNQLEANTSNSSSPFDMNISCPIILLCIILDINVEATTSHSALLNNSDSNETGSNQNVAEPVNISEALDELNSAAKKVDNWYLQRIKKRPISGVTPDADAELTW